MLEKTSTRTTIQLRGTEGEDEGQRRTRDHQLLGTEEPQTIRKPEKIGKKIKNPNLGNSDHYHNFGKKGSHLLVSDIRHLSNYYYYFLTNLVVLVF